MRARRSNRRLAAAVSAAMLAAPAAAGVPGIPGGAGSSPVRTQPLAPGEVLVEAGGIGLVAVRADLATVAGHVSSGGATPAEARRANEAKVRGVVEALRRAGVPADAINAREGDSTGSFLRTFDVDDLMPMTDADADAGAAAPAEQFAHDANSTVVVRLRDIDRAPAVATALEAAGAHQVSQPLYSLTDARPARRRAQAQALAGARADAEAHAAAINMRVARIVRVTERTGMDMYGLALSQQALFRGMRGIYSPGEEQADPEIRIGAIVGVDFALAPE